VIVSKMRIQKSGCALFIHLCSQCCSELHVYVYIYDSCQHFFVGLFICALFNAQFIYQLTDSDSEAYLVKHRILSYSVFVKLQPLFV